MKALKQFVPVLLLMQYAPEGAEKETATRYAFCNYKMPKHNRYKEFTINLS